MVAVAVARVIGAVVFDAERRLVLTAVVRILAPLCLADEFCRCRRLDMGSALVRRATV